VVAQLSAPKAVSQNRTLVLWLLTFVYMFSLVDRQIIGILSPIIKAELGFSDSQLGWLKGFAFALLYTTVGIPLAWLADRFNRVRIVGLSLILWSAFTALTGSAHTFTAMLMARIGVGVGEAGGTPPSHSIISDLYPKEQRSSALGIYALGVPLGITLSFIVGAIFVERFGWRGTLHGLGGAGILFAFVVLYFIKEPVRGQLETASEIKSEPIPLLESFATLRKIPSWWGMCLGMASVSFAGYAVAAWGTDYLFRFDPDYIAGTEGSKFSQYMLVMAAIHFFGLGAGTYLGGYFADLWSRSNVSGYAYVCAIAAALCGPLLVAAFWMSSVPAMLVCLGLYVAISGMWVAPCFAAAQTLVPVKMRAMSTAVFFLVLNLIALGGGPTIIGLVSEALIPKHGELMALRLALTSLGAVFVLGFGFFLWAAKHLPNDWPKDS